MSGTAENLPVQPNGHATPAGQDTGPAEHDINRTIRPSRVVARSLLAWGWGYLSLGDRRGGLLLALEICWVAALAAALPLLQTDRWIIDFGLLSGFFIIWVLQAAAAQGLAVRRSGTSTGATLLVAVMPLAIVVLTAFWLVGGATASPSSTFARYVSAWETRHPENATTLFITPRDVGSVDAAWDVDDRTVIEALEAVAASNPTFDLDGSHPFANLRFVYHAGPAAGGADRAALDIEIVRLATVPTSFFGLFPATRSETQPVATIGQAVLIRRPAPVPAIVGASVWLIESVTLGR